MKNRTVQPQRNKTADFTKTIDFYVEIGIYIVLVCNFFILWGNSQDITVFVSWPTRIMVTYIFLLAAYLFYEKVRSNAVERIDALFVLLVITTAICYVVTCRSNPTGRIVQYMCFLMLPGCIVLFRRIQNVRKIKKAIYVAGVAYALLLIALSFAGNSHYHYGQYGVEIVEELTLGYANPNETAIYLMLTLFVLLCAVLDVKKLFWKLTLSILSAQMLHMVWQTESRTCIVLCVTMVALLAIRRVFRVGKGSTVVALLLPAMVLGVVMAFPEWVSTQEVLGEVADTGRHKLFSSFFKTLNMESVLVGNFAAYGGSNMHNSFLTILAMFGLPATIIYMVFLHRSLRYYQNRDKAPVSYMAFVGLLMVVAHGVSESTLLTAGTVFAGMAGLLLVLTLPEETSV